MCKGETRTLTVPPRFAYGQAGIRGNIQFTLPIAKILSVKNARAWVSMVSYLKKQNQNIKKKKILGAV